mgnify:CR=1 FL=1
MKKLLIITLFLLIPSLGCAASLVCNLPEAGFTVTQTTIEITTNPGPSQTVQEVSGTATVQGSDFILYNLDSLANGKYSFRSKWAAIDGWFSDYSLPLAATKTGKPGNVRIK